MVSNKILKESAELRRARLHMKEVTQTKTGELSYNAESIDTESEHSQTKEQVNFCIYTTKYLYLHTYFVFTKK